MRRIHFMTVTTALLASALVQAADKVDVTLLARQFLVSDYQGQLPGTSSGQTTGQASCFDNGVSVNCSGASQSSGTVMPPRVTYDQAQGAILVLQAPDGRIAVVRCVSKYALRGDGINQRSCRIPPQRQFTVEFKGTDAKLRWPVGWDQKKSESETYEVVQVFTREYWVKGARERARALGAEILDEAGQ
jgi:hypothetical protein